MTIYIAAILISLSTGYTGKQIQVDNGLLHQMHAESAQKSCPSFDKLSPKEKKIYLRHQTREEICRSGFFYDNDIDPLADFLSPKDYQAYQNHLANNQCVQAEQILWRAYKKRYPHAPEIHFSKQLHVQRGAWTFATLTKRAPETLFCLMKKDLAASQNTIRTKQLATTPIKDLRRIWHVKPLSQTERIRRQALIHLYTLMRFDYAPAQILIVETSLKGEIFQLKPAPLYLILKRLQDHQQLPKKFKRLMTETESKLTAQEKEKMDHLASEKRIFLETKFPTVQP